ncbi:MAG: amino acid carrier protein [Xanthomonadaceae bacterium]|nr:amino acid carrier protein [Xanthomonadaceae bacterium]
MTFGQRVNSWLESANAFLWHDYVLVILLGTGVLFTLWSGFSQYRALTHGGAVLSGKYNNPNDPGAVNHFQALSMALSATVGLGNIGGVALAIALGGPGAVFWMWVVGFFGMAIKTTEVTLSMMYRNTDDKDNPHGGPMWVVSKGVAALKPSLAPLGKFIGGVFCITLLISAVTGGNMFQAWNVGTITQEYFNVPSIASGIILATIVGMTIIGGVKRIGSVAGKLVPSMCFMYLAAGIYVLVVNYAAVPETLKLIVVAAFSSVDAQDAFIGGTAGYAFMWGMKRALFSNEAGQGSSPVAHSAAKTDEPAREGILAGLEPFIDTIVVCTITALVILTSGVWQRQAEAHYIDYAPAVVEASPNAWTLERAPAPERIDATWRSGDGVFAIIESHPNEITGNNKHRLDGALVQQGRTFYIEWGIHRSDSAPTLVDQGIYVTYAGATLTAKAFDVAKPGLGMWMVTIAAWLFAVSTMISWSYYGEQAMIYLGGEKSVTPYKFVYCLLIIVATLGFITTPTELDNLAGLGTGVTLFLNIPITLFFAYQAMRVYKNYVARLKSGEMLPDHESRSWRDLMRGRED